MHISAHKTLVLTSLLILTNWPCRSQSMPASHKTAWSDLPLGTAFVNLESELFTTDNTTVLLHIRSAFEHRSEAAVQWAADNLNRTGDPQTSQNTSRGPSLCLAAMVLKMFPLQARPLLRKAVGQTSPRVKKQWISVFGIIGNEFTTTLLISCLDDRNPVEHPSETDEPKPLRLCDLAYNQLTPRMKTSDLLRTLGTHHDISVRDRNIALMRTRLTALPGKE